MKKERFILFILLISLVMPLFTAFADVPSSRSDTASASKQIPNTTLAVKDTSVETTTEEDTDYIVGFKERKGILPQLEVKPIESTLTISGQKTIKASYALRHYFFDKDRNVPEGFSLDQTLNVNLAGQVGPKIKVNVQWNDTQRPGQMTRPTQNISVVYTGDKDEFIKKAQFGTSVRLSLPRTKYVLYNKTLTGVKVEGSYSDPVFGKISLTGIGSITKGISGTKQWRGKDFISRAKIERQDYNMIRYRFYTVGTTNFDIKTLRIFVDNKNTTDDNTVAILATAKNDQGDDTYPDGYFTEYYQGKDYTMFDIEKGIIEFQRSLGSNFVIAVAYKTLDGQSIGYKADGTLDTQNLLLIKDEENSEYYNKYEVMNIYDLGHRDIRRDNFQIEIKNLQTPADQNNTIAPDGTAYIQYFGLDRDGDGDVDDNDGVVDFERGLLVFPDARPFYKDHPEAYLKDTNFETQMYVITVIYEYKSKFLQSVDFDIVENSEKVYVDGKLLKKDVDYYIDYEFGQITFLNEDIIKPDSIIRVDYEKYPFGIGGQESVIGLNITHELSKNFNWGLTWLYSGGAKPIDDAPKITSCPENIQIFDLNFKLSPLGYLNHGLSLLPLFNRLQVPDTYVKLGVSGEVAYSLRNPNTFGKALIDDMETSESIVSVSNYYQTWFWGSAPTDTGARGFVSLSRAENFAHEQKPNEIIDSLKIDYKYLYSPGDWVSIIHLLSAYGENLEDYSTLKIWYYADASSVGNELYIDIGELSEDADGDRVLDSEDKDKNKSLGYDEDIGVTFNDSFTWTTGPVIYGANDDILENEDLDNDGNIVNDGTDKFRLRYRIKIEKSGWNSAVIKLDSDTNWYNGGDYLKNVKYIRLWLKRDQGASQGTIHIESIDFSRVNWYSSDEQRVKVSVVTTQDDEEYRNNAIEEVASDEIKDIFKQLHPRASEFIQEQTIKEGALQIEVNFDALNDSVSKEGIYKNITRGKEIKQLRFYNKLKFFLYHFTKVDTGYLVVKLGKTANDYFGYKINLKDVPVKQWLLYTFDVQELIEILAQTGDTNIYSSTTGFNYETDSFVIKGKPDIFYVNKIMFDFICETGVLQDTFWINDIFVDDVQYRKGMAYTISGNLKLHKYLDLTGTLSFKDSNFKVLGQVLLPGEPHITSQNAVLRGKLTLIKFMPVDMSYSVAKTTTDPEDRQNVLYNKTGSKTTRDISLGSALRLPRYLPSLSFKYTQSEGILNLYNDTYSFIKRSFSTSAGYNLKLPIPRIYLFIPFIDKSTITSAYNYSLNYSSLDYGTNADATHKNKYSLGQKHGISLSTKLNIFKFISLSNMKYSWSQSFKRDSTEKFYDWDSDKDIFYNIKKHIIGIESDRSFSDNFSLILERIRGAVKSQSQSAGTNFSLKLLKGMYPTANVTGRMNETFHLLANNKRGKDVVTAMDLGMNLRVTPSSWLDLLKFIKYIQLKYSLKLKADYKNVESSLALVDIWHNFYAQELKDLFGYSTEAAESTPLNVKRVTANKNISLSGSAGYRFGKVSDFTTSVSKGINVTSRNVTTPAVSKSFSVSQSANINLVKMLPFLSKVYRTSNWNLNGSYKSTYNENSKQEQQSYSINHTWPMSFVNKYNLTLKTTYATGRTIDRKEANSVELKRNVKATFSTATNFKIPLPSNFKLPFINRPLMANTAIATNVSVSSSISRSYEKQELRTDNFNIAVKTGASLNISRTVKSGLSFTTAYNKDKKNKKNDYIEFKLAVNFAITF